MPIIGPRLMSQVVDQILLLAVQPSGQGEDEELQSMWHAPRLRPRHTVRPRPSSSDSAAQPLSFTLRDSDPGCSQPPQHLPFTFDQTTGWRPVGEPPAGVGQ